jgi:transketolase
VSARGHNRFDVAAARRRCKAYRRRILDISQTIGALHIAPAFSCLEIVDVIYHGLMRKGDDGAYVDRFLMSKGHGCMAQYAILEELGVLDERELELYCKPGGRLGAHPDYGVPGIEASTGSLGHGLGMAAGMAYADKLQQIESAIYCLVGDGEMQEGSIWEAVMMAPNLSLGSLVAILDFNDYQGLGRTTETHPHFLPMTDKVRSFGWETADVNGHDAAAVHAAIAGRAGDRPFFLVCNTVKGKGVSYMEHAPIWHYRAPSPDEYREAIEKLTEVSS